jgi:hypothetical protein
VNVLLLLALFGDAPWAIKCSLLCEQGNLAVIRPHSVTITEFGAVGDGVTLNTKAFQNAIFYLNSFADKGGAKLFVPTGRWLTGSFDLISHLTLWLDKDAVILGSTVSPHFHAREYVHKMCVKIFANYLQLFYLESLDCVNLEAKSYCFL